MSPVDATGKSRAGPISSGALGRLSRRLAEEIDALDQASYDAVASTPTPTMDVPFTWISKAANHSGLWVVIAAALAVAGGSRGRRAAILGLMTVGVTSITANLVLKHIFRRRRPKKPLLIAAGRQVRVPTSSSFPSGHTASAFADAVDLRSA